MLLLLTMSLLNIILIMHFCQIKTLGNSAFFLTGGLFPGQTFWVWLWEAERTSLHLFHRGGVLAVFRGSRGPLSRAQLSCSTRGPKLISVRRQSAGFFQIFLSSGTRKSNSLMPSAYSITRWHAGDLIFVEPHFNNILWPRFDLLFAGWLHRCWLFAGVL